MRGAGIYLRYTTYSGASALQEITSFQYDGMRQRVQVGMLKPHISGEVKCISCGATDWTDNGRYINEYECGCCGDFITIEPRN